jgi:excisionase family DNA binding protein
MGIASVNMPNVKSLDDAARLAGVHRRTIQRWLGDGLLTPYRIPGDRKRYVDLDELSRLRAPQPLPRKGVAEIAIGEGVSNDQCG